MDIILRYFSDLDEEKINQLGMLAPLYREWNARINLISRKDIDHLYLHHVLHSLAIAKLIRFEPAARILDLGTGGGFPGIPLAILMPDVEFHLIDGTLKKIKVVKDLVENLHLKNVRADHIRAEDLKGSHYDFVVSRAVANLEQLRLWSQRLLRRQHRHALPNGILALKGGNVQAEIKLLPKGEYVECYAIFDFFSEEYFREKFIVYLQG